MPASHAQRPHCPIQSSVPLRLSATSKCCPHTTNGAMMSASDRKQ